MYRLTLLRPVSQEVALSGSGGDVEKFLKLAADFANNRCDCVEV